MLDTEEAVFDQVIAVSPKGVLCGCKYGIPPLLRAGGGSLITTASFVAGMGSATAQSAYTASKGGVLALTREIAVEFARRTHARIGSAQRSPRIPAADRCRASGTLGRAAAPLSVPRAPRSERHRSVGDPAADPSETGSYVKSPAHTAYALS